MNKASRRMWARRVLRAGWMVAPVLALPGRIGRWFFVDSDTGRFNAGGAIGFTLILAFVVGVPSCTKWQMHLDAIATTAEINVALTGNPCMIEMMPRWQVVTKKPLTNRDLLMGSNSCEEATGAHYEIEKQKAAMAAVK